MKRYLIVNADDFGQSHGINQGIITAYERGIVTSASLMVRWPAAAEAAAYSQRHPNLSLGLHVDCGEYAFRNGQWVSVYDVVPMHDVSAVAEEVSRQLDTFRCLMGGRNPTHIDSHQHRHLQEPLRTLLGEIARTLGVPLRHCAPHIRYCGDFYGQTAEGTPLPGILSVQGLTNILAQLQTGFTELACHPGEAYDLDTMYGHERTEEMRVLCDARVQGALTTLDITLCSFQTLVRPIQEAPDNKEQ
jgi:predicted glycoside hydrolase/deacetylase ChbG (UPF0249 family)